MEEIFKDTDHLPTNEPLPDNGPILEGLLESSLEDEAIWIQAKTSISQGLAHQHIDNKAKVELPEVYAEYRTVFEKEASDECQNEKHGITPLISKQILSPKIAKSILCHPKNRKNKTNSSKKISEKDISDPRNLLWHHHSSLSPRKTRRNSDRAKIIDD